MMHESPRVRLHSVLGGLRGGASFLPEGNDTFPGRSMEEAELRLLVVRLSPASSVEESVSHLVLAESLASRLPGVFVDFAFQPHPRDRKLLAKAGLPLWPGIRSCEGAGNFHGVLVSCSWIPELLNLSDFLTSSGLALHARDRDAASPPVILGGSAALMAQSALSRVDLLHTGEFEQATDAFAEALALLATEGKSAFLARLRRLPGSAWQEAGGGLGHSGPAVPWAPGNSVPGRADLPWPVLNDVHARTVRLVTSRGCPFRCSFCFEGAVRKPYREASRKTLAEEARILRRRSGASSVDLLSFNFNTHRDILGLVADLSRTFPHVHLMSQRLDILWRSPDLLKGELETGKRSFTLGFEGISPRMRRYFRKDLREEAVTGIMEQLLAAKVGEIKCFYIISGHETPDDLEAYGEFLDHVRELKSRFHASTTLVCSFGFLSAMPHTPLSLLPVLQDPAPMEGVRQRLEAGTASRGVLFRMGFHEGEWYLGQVLSLAGQEEGGTLLDALASRGALLEGESCPSRNLVASLLPPSGEVQWFPPVHPLEALVPPDVLRIREEGAVIAREILAGEDSLSSGAVSGVPDSGRPWGDKTEGSGPSHRDPAGLKELQDALPTFRRVRRCLVHCAIPRNLAGALPEWIASWMSRRILALPGGEALAMVRDAGHGERTGRESWGPWWGDNLYELTFREGADILDLGALKDPEIRILEESVPGSGGLPALHVAADLSGPGEDRDPGAFRMSLQGGFQKALESVHVPATLEKSGALTRFTPSAKIRKKAVVQGLSLEFRASGEVRLEMDVLPRLDLREFLYRALGAGHTAFLPVEIRFRD